MNNEFRFCQDRVNIKCDVIEDYTIIAGGIVINGDFPTLF